MEENDKNKKDMEELDNSNNEENSDIDVVIDEDDSEAELVSYEDAINTSLTIDDIKDLNEEDSYILIEKIDIEMEQYEDIYMKSEEQGDSYEELVAKGYNEEEYKRLKDLRKAIYKNLKSLKKVNKESGLFAKVPGWYFLIAVVVFLLTIAPVSPLLPAQIGLAVLNTFVSLQDYVYATYIIVFVLYTLILLSAELIPALIYLKKGKNSNEKFKIAKYMFTICIIGFVLMIPGIFLFIRTMF